MDPFTLVLGASAIFIAVISQLLTGFGFAMVLVPLLMLSLGPADAVVITTLLGAVLTTFLVVRDRQHIDRRRAATLLAWSLAGLPLGVLALDSLAAATLKWSVVGVVAASLLIVLSGVSLRSGRLNSAFAGISSGTLLTSTGINGPPLVALVRSSQKSVLQYRSTLAAVFCGQGWLGFSMFAMTGKLNTVTLSLSGVGLLAMPLGILVGERLFKHVDAGRLRIGIIVMLILSLLAVVLR